MFNRRIVSCKNNWTFNDKHNVYILYMQTSHFRQRCMANLINNCLWTFDWKILIYIW